MNTSFSSIPTGSTAYTIKDMTSSEIDTLQQNMYPEMLSFVGFLATSQKITEVCQQDWDFLNTKKISCEKIGCALRTITEMAAKEDRSLQKPVTVFGKFEVSLSGLATNGYQQCPFGGKTCHTGRASYTIKNILTDQTVTYSKLAIGLIEEHGFFLGHGTPYRVEPKAVIEVLELKEGDKDIHKQNYLKTIRCDMIDEDSQNNEKVFEEKAKNKIVIDSKTTAYFGLQDPDIDVILGTNDVGSTDDDLFSSTSSVIKDKGLVPPSKLEKMKKAPPPEYCYIFCYANPEAPIESIGDYQLDTPIKSDGIYIFEQKVAPVYIPNKEESK
jgi:hypothetical protein